MGTQASRSPHSKRTPTAFGIPRVLPHLQTQCQVDSIKPIHNDFQHHERCTAGSSIECDKKKGSCRWHNIQEYLSVSFRPFRWLSDWWECDFDQDDLGLDSFHLFPNSLEQAPAEPDQDDQESIWERNTFLQIKQKDDLVSETLFSLLS